MFSPGDEFDPHEFVASLKRRRRWFLGGIFLGLAFAVGNDFTRPEPKAQVQMQLLVNTGLGPCKPNQVTGLCMDKNTADVARSQLDILAADKFSRYTLKPYSYSAKDKSKSLIKLQAVSDLTQESQLKERMAELVDEYRQQAFAKYGVDIAVNPNFDGWIKVSGPSPLPLAGNHLNDFLANIFAGFVLGTGVALLVDRKANRVFKQSLILKLLGYPLRLSLPSLPWYESEVNPLIGQLSSQMDPSLDWCVLSIAHNHEAVPLLAQSLREQHETSLNCSVAEPLLTSVLDCGASSAPLKGILVIVESGFNSAHGLEQARLLLEKMPHVKEIGVVLIGVPLPEELMGSKDA